MVGCAAPSCSNNSKKGKIRFFRFPRDKSRCHLWLVNCRRDNWKPTFHSVLCEAHFEENQYELNRQDGRKLLKNSAIPTIFDVSYTPNQPTRRRLVKTVSQNKNFTAGIDNVNINEESINEEASSINQLLLPNPPESYTSLISPPPDRLVLEIQQNENFDTGNQNVNSNNGSRNGDDICQHDTPKRRKRLDLLRNQIKCLQRKNARLTKALESHNKQLQKFLQPDQIQYLRTVDYHNTQPWSAVTIQKCIQLHLHVGRRGYNYLREQGYPCPSYKTLIRHLKNNPEHQKNKLEPIQYLYKIGWEQ